MPIETKEARMTTTPTAPARDPLAGDPDAATIRAIVAAIVDMVHPLAVILFGSRARGDYHAQSDADLLIVMPEGTTTRMICRALDAHRALVGVRLPVDIIGATPQRLAAARGDYSSVLHWAQEHGVDLYRAEGYRAVASDERVEAAG